MPQLRRAPAVPDADFGEVLAAHVELDEGASLSADQIRDHVKSHMAGYKTTRVVEFGDSLPREDSGKIFKRRPREPYWVGRQRRSEPAPGISSTSVEFSYRPSTSLTYSPASPSND